MIINVLLYVYSYKIKRYTLFAKYLNQRHVFSIETHTQVETTGLSTGPWYLTHNVQKTQWSKTLWNSWITVLMGYVTQKNIILSLFTHSHATFYCLLFTEHKIRCLVECTSFSFPQKACGKSFIQLSSKRTNNSKLNVIIRNA